MRFRYDCHFIMLVRTLEQSVALLEVKGLLLDTQHSLGAKSQKEYSLRRLSSVAHVPPVYGIMHHLSASNTMPTNQLTMP